MMKNKLLVLLMLFHSIYAFSQNNVVWKEVDNKNNDYEFKKVFYACESGVKAVFTIPINRPFSKTKHNVFIRNYDLGLTNYSEESIPIESPKLVSITGFRDYNLIIGNMDNKTSKDAWYNKDNVLVITDNKMNTLVYKTFPLHSKLNRYDQLPEILISSDSNYLIVVNTEMQNPFKLTVNDYSVIRYIDVYDRLLNHIWSDSIDNEIIFKKKHLMTDFNFDFHNGKLYMVAAFENRVWAKDNSNLFLVEFNKPQEPKIIMNKEFIYELFSIKSTFSKNGKVYVSGYSTNNPAVTTTLSGLPKRQLFYLCKDLENPEQPPVFNSYEITNEIMQLYPKYKRIFKKFIINPQQIFIINNELFYCCDVLLKSLSKSLDPLITYEFGQTLIIHFSSEGKIKRIIDINKNVTVKTLYDDNVQFAKFYPESNGIRIFYLDNKENVNSSKLKSLQSLHFNNMCLATARISLNGEIQKSIVSEVSNSKVIPDVAQIRKVNDKLYILIGKGNSITNNSNFYFGKFEVNN